MKRLVSLSVLALALLLAAPAPAETPLTCRRIPQLMQHFLRQHVAHRELTAELKQRAADVYVRRLDPSRWLLLEKDADAITDRLIRFFDEVERGDCRALGAIHRDLLERHRKLEAWMRKEMARPDHALDPELELVVDPEKRGYPDTPEERRALHARLAQFTLSNYLNTGIELDEAREKLVHRYELLTRRWSEQEPRDLYAALLDAFATSLDPHSNYLSAEMLEEFQISTSLSLEGIGAALSSRDGYAVVEQIIPGGAADRHGQLRPNDRIIAVAQEGGDPVDVIDMDLQDVVRLIRGEKGSKVELTVIRQGDPVERLVVVIERDKIDLAEQAAKVLYETVERDDESYKLAILDLSSFYGDRDPRARQSSADVAQLLEEVARQEADGLLLDLSRNGGGLLDHAVRIAGFFIRSGGIVAVKEAGRPSHVLRDPDDRILYNGPLVVLTSRLSASASEILAGAMKDYRRAIVVGDDHTFGKGSVQTVVPLPTGLGAVKVTTGIFFRPGGESTQNVGVRSDIVVPSIYNDDAYGEKAQDYALHSERTEPFLSEDANSPVAFLRWKPVSDAVRTELASRSVARVSESEEFAQIAERLEESDEGEGVIQLSQVMGGSDGGADADADASADAGPNVRVGGSAGGNASAGEAGLASGEDEEELGPQVREALEILADYVALTS